MIIIKNEKSDKNCIDIQTHVLTQAIHTQDNQTAIALTITKANVLVSIMKSLRQDNNVIDSTIFSEYNQDNCGIKPLKMYKAKTDRFLKLVPRDNNGSPLYNVTFDKNNPVLMSSSSGIPHLNISWLTSQPIDNETLGVFVTHPSPFGGGAELGQTYCQLLSDLLTRLTTEFVVQHKFVVTGMIKVVKTSEVINNLDNLIGR